MIVSQNQEAHQVPKRTSQSLPGVELSVIIVNWNSFGFVRQCLKSIQNHAPAVSYEVIVVDSGSFDGCGEMLKREFPEVHFIQSQENVGFARANNLGARSSRGQWLLFLNPDTEIMAPTIDKLVETLEQNPDAGLVGAHLLNSDGSLQMSCIQSFPTILNQVLDCEWLRRIFPRSRLWGMSPLHAKSLSASDVEVISGACIMIRSSVFEKLSGFDERFFMYSEDLDLCHRARQAGWRCLYVPDAVIVHFGGGSSSSAQSMFSVVMMRESVYRLLIFHRGWLVALGHRVTLGLSALVRLLLILIRMAALKIFGASTSPVPLWKWTAILRWSLGFETWAEQQHAGKRDKPLAVRRPKKNRNAASAGTGV